VFALRLGQVSGATVNYLSITIVLARVIQSLVHVCLPQTNTVTAIRFTFFLIQILCFLALIAMIVRQAGFR
jgi:hypothetical protein